MSEPTTPADPAAPPAEDDDSSSTNASLGITFAMLGLVLMLTLTTPASPGCRSSSSASPSS